MKYYDIELNKVLNENELRKDYEEYIKDNEINMNFGQYINQCILAGSIFKFDELNVIIVDNDDTFINGEWFAKGKYILEPGTEIYWPIY